MITQKNRLVGILVTIAIILLIPFVAMQFSEDVNWVLPDFLIAGTLLLGTGLACELILRNIKKKGNRIALCIVIVTILLLVWAELAVGIFGTPLAGN